MISHVAGAFRFVPIKASSWTHLGRHSLSRQRVFPIQATWIDSRGVSTPALESNDISHSGRDQFKQIPVNSSILNYIQAVGVGKSGRRKRRKKRPASDSNLLSVSEERELLERNRRPLVPTPPPPPFPIPTSLQKAGDSTSVQRLPVKLLGSVGSVDEEFPKVTPNLSEVAIAGRSNVGKSTLLNALLYASLGQDSSEDSTSSPRARRRKKGPTSQTARLPRGVKAATSSKPGETRKLSFYQLSSKVTGVPVQKGNRHTSKKAGAATENPVVTKKVSLLLVDLPGFGFAYASEDKATEWQKLMQSYLLQRGSALRRILLLVDSRHGMKRADFDFLESLQSTLLSKEAEPSRKKLELPPIQLVLTKCDLMDQADLARRVTQVQQQLSDSLRRQPSILPIMLVSAQMEGQAGVLELQKELSALVPHHLKLRPSPSPTLESKPKPELPKRTWRKESQGGGGGGVRKRPSFQGQRTPKGKESRGAPRRQSKASQPKRRYKKQ